MPRKDGTPNLKPIRTKERAKRIGALGGKANKNNPKTRDAAKLRWLRERNVKDSDVEWLYERMTDPTLSIIYINKLVQQFGNIVSKDQETPDGKRLIATWMKMVMDSHKLRHGDGKAPIQLNIQNNVYVSQDDRKSKIKEMLDLE